MFVDLEIEKRRMERDGKTRAGSDIVVVDEDANFLYGYYVPWDDGNRIYTRWRKDGLFWADQQTEVRHTSIDLVEYNGVKLRN